jgi:hypothetical protein
MTAYLDELLDITRSTEYGKIFYHDVSCQIGVIGQYTVVAYEIQSCATCTYAMSMELLPILVVMEYSVPLLTVTYSRITTLSPISTTDFSPLYLRFLRYGRDDRTGEHLAIPAYPRPLQYGHVWPYPGAFTNLYILADTHKGLHDDALRQFGTRVYVGERLIHALFRFLIGVLLISDSKRLECYFIF